ncbi:TonB-dependent receptor [Parapedobacter sp. 2B3]|uniref:TonB-dependent receptor n=1 Tax=Parapedobacter sp. 2B3 TaxID=3342381 RepID=UPI0035B66E4C
MKKNECISWEWKVPRLQKVFRIMKLTVFLLLLSVISVFASKSYSQTTLLNLDMENSTVKEVLRNIEKQSEFVFMYSEKLIDVNHEVSVTVKNKKINEVLDELFAGTDVSYKVKDRFVLLTTPEVTGSDFMAQQQKLVSGKVTDSGGLPLPGVTVVVKGTTQSTVTNADGEYSLSNIPEDATLVFSFVGMRTQEIVIGNQTTINISMVEDMIGIEEVVAVGYGTMRKSDLTGAISSVKSEDLSMIANTSVGQMLAGKASGLQVIQNTAQPGGAMTFLIRGAGSINASNLPLLIIDGFPITEDNEPRSGNRYDGGAKSYLNFLNPQDIESIEVLKDASATSIYGARAANGVIIITTKKGEEGKIVINYNGSYTIQTPSDMYDMMNAKDLMIENNRHFYEKWMYDNKIGIYGGKTEAEVIASGNPHTPRFLDSEIKNPPANTNWFNEITRNGFINQHNISISGGNKDTKYFLSGNYNDHQGILKNSHLKRYSSRLNLDQNVGKYIKIGIVSNISRIENDNTQLGAGKYENAGIIQTALCYPSYLPVYDEKGEFSIPPGMSWLPNPVSMLSISDKSVNEKILASTYFEVSPIKNLKLRLNAGVDRNIGKRSTYLPKSTLYGKTDGGNASISQNEKLDSNFDLTMNYSKTINQNHSFGLLVGHSYQKFTWEGFNAQNSDFIIDGFLYYNLAAGAFFKPSVGSYGGSTKMASYFSRFNYFLSDKYLLTATIRADGASNFAANKKWGYFPSVALGWRISDETFMEGFKNSISNLKLRLSYGQTGNSNIGNRAFSNYRVGENYNIGGVESIGIYLSQLANHNLSWETTTEKNIGIDFGLIKNRISGSIEFYDKVISNLLNTRYLMSYHEVNSIAANIGKTQGQGYELSVSSKNIVSDGFSWTSDFTFSHYKDRWKERDKNWSPAIYENENDPVRPIFTYISEGLIQPGEQIAAMPGAIPGQVKIKDIDGFKKDADGKYIVDEKGRFQYLGKPDGKIDDADRILFGSMDPGYSFGFNNNFKYKNFDLSIYFYGLFDRYITNQMYASFAVNSLEIERGQNFLNIAKTRWTHDNQETNFPSAFQSYSTYGYGDFLLEKAWFIRCKNITVGYTLPKISNITNVRLYFDVQNLFIITPYTGLDPETDFYQGAYPNSRSFSFGIDIKF